jgi:hypothetical protein
MLRRFFNAAEDIFSQPDFYAPHPYPHLFQRLAPRFGAL